MKRVIAASYGPLTVLFLIFSVLIAVGLSEGYLEVGSLQSLAKWLGLCILSVGMFVASIVQWELSRREATRV